MGDQGDFSTTVDGGVGGGFYNDGSACQREVRRVARSTRTWVYVIIFVLLFLVLLFVILIYGKVKGVAIKPASMMAANSKKPGKTFTASAASSSEENDSSEDP